MVSKWIKERNQPFYMHCNASNEAIESILVQKIIRNLDSLMYYIKKNYNITKKEEVIAIVYLVQTF
uniref:Uncharacterized protein n=1 Tax=Physcomitrium patens TaxID=3218 RepID=A0A2K1L334_PHYPA|nr:hypothetical protein PHYPA_003228 [Physcomitrium patens]